MLPLSGVRFELAVTCLTTNLVLSCVPTTYELYYTTVWISLLRLGRQLASDVLDGPAWRGSSAVKRTFGFCFRCSVIEVKQISPAV